MKKGKLGNCYKNGELISVFTSQLNKFFGVWWTRLIVCL